MAFYQLTAHEGEAIEQFEADPVYGPFDYDVVECPEGFPY